MAPLGYDTGFYIGSIKSLYQPLTPATSFLYQLSLRFRRGFPPFSCFLAVYILSGEYCWLVVVFCLFTPYTTAQKIAVILVALFALSSIQFMAYWWAFAQQMLAASFLIGSLAFST